MKAALTNELPLIALIVVVVLLLLLVLAKVATREETPGDKPVSVWRRGYYFLEIAGEEVGKLVTAILVRLQRFFGK